MTTTSVVAYSNRRRNRELLLLVFALLLGSTAYAAVEMAHGTRWPPDLLPYGAAIVALFGLAHIVVRKVAPYADPLLLPGVVLLNGIGLAMIHRLDLAAADRARQLGRTLPGGDA
jgi:hypothetical protein